MHLMTPNIMKERSNGLTSISGSKNQLRLAIALMAELPINDKWILAINRSAMSKSWDYLNRNQMFGWVWCSSVDEKGPLLYMVKNPNLDKEILLTIASL